jgi:hypothetical protein
MSRRLGLLVAWAALAILAILWRLDPNASPPVYDGVCFADPYRFVGSSPTPASVSKTFPPSSSFGPVAVLNMAENPAQAQMILTAGTFSSPNAAFTVSIAPVPPPAIAPSDGHIDGNVYRLTANTFLGTPLSPKEPVTIILRATRSDAPRSLERFDGTAWKPLQTFAEGCGDTFAATSDRLGDFAMVITRQPPANSGGGVPIVPIIAGLAVVILAAVFMLTRYVRR